MFQTKYNNGLTYLYAGTHSIVLAKIYPSLSLTSLLKSYLHARLSRHIEQMFNYTLVGRVHSGIPAFTWPQNLPNPKSDAPN